MAGKFVRSTTVLLACTAAAVLSATPSTAVVQPQPQAIAWDYDAAQHVITINQAELFTTELCLGSTTLARCVLRAEVCVAAYQSVGNGWVDAIDNRGRPRCPQAAGTPNSDLGQAMAEVVAYWKAN
ncbi:hypothetical protein [Streptomyces sp. NPDC001770]